MIVNIFRMTYRGQNFVCTNPGYVLRIVQWDSDTQK